MKSFACFCLVLMISMVSWTPLVRAQTAALATPIQPVAQSLVIECKIRLEDPTGDGETSCGSTSVDIKNLDTKKSQALQFDGGIFTIPVHTDFGRFKIHVQPKRCPKNRDYKTALVGSITTLTFEHCK